MKVLHLSGSVHHWSGNEQQLADLIHNLTPLGITSQIFCYEGSAIEQYAQQKGITTHSQKRKSIYNPLLAKELMKCIQRHSIDVLHVHTTNFLTVYVIADLLFNIKIPTVFSRKGFSEKSSMISRLKYNYKGLGAVICVSDAVRRNFSQFVSVDRHDKLHVIYDGITIPPTATHKDEEDQVRDLYSIPRDKILIGNIANHVTAKDLPTLVRTLDYLVNTIGRTDIHLLQIGDHTAITSKLTQMVSDANISDYISFTGKISNASRWMPQFDLYLMTSQSEGLPLAIYEAFLHHVPVVSTNAGGIPEAITQDENGLMTNIGDYVGLAKALDLLITNQDKRNQFSTAAHHRLLNHFTACHCAEQTRDLYLSIQRRP